MKILRSMLLNVAALLGCAGWSRDSAGQSQHGGLEFCIVSRAPGTDVESRLVTGTDNTLLVNLPPAISSFDLKQARAATSSSWYLLSGNHRTSTLLLSLKPEAQARVQAAIRSVIDRGDRLAILLDGEVIGVLVLSHQLEGAEIAIDASFFSAGTEKEKEVETRTLARKINATLP